MLFLCYNKDNMERDAGMKKLCLIFFLLCFSCFGCTASKSESSKEPIYFLFATPLSNHTLWLQAKQGMEDACKELDIYCDWKGPTGIDTEEMENVIMAGLLQKCNGIITQGVIDPSLIEQGKQQGIPFVLVDSGIKDSNPLATITKDFEQQADLLLNDIEKTLGKDKKLYIGIQVSQLSFDLAQGQLHAVEKVFQKHPGGYEIIAISESKSDKLHAREEWQKVLNKKMNVALNFAGEGAAGCIEAINQDNSNKGLLVYGVDDMKDTLALIKEGKVKGSVVTSFYNYGYDGVKILYEHVVNEKNPENAQIGAKLMLLNDENIASYQQIR